ncbi:hypothetical protein QC761_0085830 [Podospora bellae-mahoneyi]|uniref:Uncharacterized protein n=1 Tax=Podospora bellae-mahoneyi TaxID=2093777 RepID=A0ABR0FHM1_9PEZI|nr:hypothetical protein QC761_0085830 [Podospora bellae-mahoneyi]
MDPGTMSSKMQSHHRPTEQLPHSPKTCATSRHSMPPAERPILRKILPSTMV